MKHLLFIASIILTSTVFSSAQYGIYRTRAGRFNVELSRKEELRRYLDTAGLAKQLDSYEQALVYYVNYARRFPKDFSREAIVPYLELNPSLKKGYGESLIRELQEQSALPSFTLEIALIKMAGAHAADLAKHQLLSHSSSDGTSMQQRMERAGIACGAECINMANAVPALEVVISLLIDYGVVNLGHRRSLLAPEMRQIGVSRKESKASTQYVVLDLGCN